MNAAPSAAPTKVPTAKSERERRRSRLVVDRDFQYRFTLKLCLWGGSLLALAIGVVLLFVKVNHDMLVQNALTQMPDAVASLHSDFRRASLAAVQILLVILVALFGLGLYLTRKIVGPIIALQYRLRELAEGKPGVRLRLRKNDEFRNIEVLFNGAMESVEDRQRTVADELRSIENDLVEGEAGQARQRVRDLLVRMGGR